MKKKPLLLGALLLVITGCATLWPQFSEQLTNPYGGYLGKPAQSPAPLNPAQRSHWLASTLPAAPVSLVQASAIEDSAFTYNFVMAVWLRFSKSAAAEQYKRFRTSYQQANSGYHNGYATGYANSTPMQLPPNFVDEPYSELRMLAERGDSYAEYSLGDFYVRMATQQWPYIQTAPTIAADPNCLTELHGLFCRHAYFWMRKAAEQNVAAAQDVFGWMEQTGFGSAVNLEDSIHWYTLAAAQGNVPAQYQLAEIYSGGANENLPLAVHYYRMVAHQGQANAQFALAMAYRRGVGTPRNLTRSSYYLQKADAAQYPPAVKFESKLLIGPLEARARAGDARAQFSLALADYQGLYEGHFVAQDSRDAAYWFGRGAARGYAPAEWDYACCLNSGIGVEADQPAAYHWARRAAWQHLAMGEAMLGQLYLNGDGVAKNYSKAIHWLNLAVAQGNANAEVELGWMYATGTGVAANFHRAVYWDGLAAKQGNTTAESNLRGLQQMADGGSGTYNPMIAAGMVHQQQDEQARTQQEAAAEAQSMQRVNDANAP